MSDKTTVQIHNKSGCSFHTEEGTLAGGGTYTVSTALAEKMKKNYPKHFQIVVEDSPAPKPEKTEASGPAPAEAAPKAESTSSEAETAKNEAEDLEKRKAKFRADQLADAKKTFIEKGDSMTRKELEDFVGRFELETIQVEKIKTKDELKHVIGKVLGRE